MSLDATSGYSFHYDHEYHSPPCSLILPSASLPITPYQLFLVPSLDLTHALLPVSSLPPGIVLFGLAAVRVIVDEAYD